MARYWCERCGEESNTLSEPHLCKDIKKRLARREKQVEAVENLLYARSLSHLDAPISDRQFAESVVTKLAGMGVTDDA